MNTNSSLLERFRACIVLHSAGDCMGYRNNKWEFNFVGRDIHEDLKELGGIDNLQLNKGRVFFIQNLFNILLFKFIISYSILEIKR